MLLKFTDCLLCFVSSLYLVKEYLHLKFGVKSNRQKIIYGSLSVFSSLNSKCFRLEYLYARFDIFSSISFLCFFYLHSNQLLLYWNTFRYIVYLYRIELIYSWILDEIKYRTWQESRERLISKLHLFYLPANRKKNKKKNEDQEIYWKWKKRKIIQTYQKNNVELRQGEDNKRLTEREEKETKKHVKLSI